MAAAWYGFDPLGLSPEYKFDPTDDDLVTHYLLPRALGLPGPHEHAVIEADPGGLPPRQVLETHGIDMFAADQAFFFGPVPDASHNAGRMVRRVEGGGFWQGQSGDDGIVVFLRGDGSEVDVRFKAYSLTFYESKDAPSTGFVMHEFVIVDPPLPGVMLTRIRFDKARERRAGKLGKESAADDGGPELVSAGKQPVADGGGDGLFNGGYGGDYYEAPLGVVFPGSGEFSGGGCYFPDLDTQLEQSTSYSQAEYDEYYQQQQYQQFLLFPQYQMEQQCWQTGDPTNGGEGYSGGGEGFGGGEQQQQQQAGGVLCGGGYDAGSDHGSDVGTDGSGVSTISHCGAADADAGEVEGERSAPKTAAMMMPSLGTSE